MSKSDIYMKYRVVFAQTQFSAKNCEKITFSKERKDILF